MALVPVSTWTTGTTKYVNINHKALYGGEILPEKRCEQSHLFLLGDFLLGEHYDYLWYAKAYFKKTPSILWYNLLILFEIILNETATTNISKMEIL